MKLMVAILIITFFQCFASEIFTSSYIVKNGDTIGSIAKRAGVSSNEIVKWNSIANPNMIRIGQKLVLEPSFNLDKAVEAFCLQESSNNPNAVGDNGQAVGILQLHPDKVIDWNKHHPNDKMHYGEMKPDGKSYYNDDRLDRNKSIRIFKWWMTWKKASSIDECTRWWNGGAVGNRYGKMYITRYREICKRGR